jgi:hypothetical protein
MIFRRAYKENTVDESTVLKAGLPNRRASAEADAGTIETPA